MNHIRVRHFTVAVALAVLVQAHGSIAYAQTDAQSSVLVEQIRRANVVDPSFKLQVAVEGEEAVITTQRKPKASDPDCKIEAVLLAKTVFDSVSDKIQRVKVLLLDYDANDCSSVIVKKAEVKLFGTGGLTQKELLSSLEITKATISGSESKSLSVADGPQQPERLLLLGRIERLKTKGTNVVAFMNYFNQLEASAKKGDASELSTQVRYLSEKLSEQEEMVKQAKMRVNSSAGGVGGGGGTRTTSTAELASKYAKGELSQSQLTMIDLAQQQMRVTQKLTELSSRGQDMSDGLRQIGQARSFAELGQFAEAKKILDGLEQRYGH
jgi:hypothetical protein